MIKEFKVYYGANAATRQRLDAIEEIVVTQEVGNTWEARIKIPICIAEDGSWDGENDSIYREGARVRVEAQINDSGWVPLIDGTIQAKVRDLNAEPGLSSVTIVVNDDIVILNQKQVSESFPGGTSDSDIATQIFSDAGFGTPPPDVEAIDTPPDPNSITNQHGTAMAMLQSLVARNPGFKAYVLPGESPGISKGCFKKLPTATDGLPKMYLTGPKRNLASFNVSQNSRLASRVRGTHLSTRDMSIASGDSSYRDHVPLGGEGATTLSDAAARERRLPAATGDHVNHEEAAAGASLESSYTLTAEGSVLPQCYGKILTPYRMVSVSLSNSRFSTKYVIYRVTHTLGRSEYTQSFSLRGNIASPATSPSASVPAGAAVVAGAAAISFNVQIDIF